MALFGAAQLFDANTKRPICGGALLLTDASPISKVLLLGNGWHVEVFKGLRFVVVRGSTRAGYSTTFLQTLLHVERGLDLLSLTGDADLSTVRVDDEHMVWWRKRNGLTLRVHRVQTILTTDAQARELTVTDRTGKIRASPPAAVPTWQESTRYFRRSQLTSDLLDAFRNLYLALESILNYIAPISLKSNGKPAEGEGAWLKRALGVAGGVIDLNRHAPPGVGSAENRVFDLVYKYRNAIFHAKDTPFAVLPGDSTAQREIDAARRVLLGIYQDLAEKVLFLRRPTGGLTTHAFRMAIMGVIEVSSGSIDLRVTDDLRKINPKNPVPPAGMSLLNVPTRHQSALDQPLVRTYTGRAPTSTLTALTGIARLLVLDRSGHVAVDLELPECLTLDGVDELEIQLGLRMRTRRAPKHLYDH